MIKTNIISCLTKSKHKICLFWGHLCVKIYKHGKQNEFKCVGLFADSSMILKDYHSWDYMFILGDYKKYKIINIPAEILFMNIL